MNKIIRYPLETLKVVNSAFGPRTSGDKYHDGVDLDCDYKQETVFNVFDGYAIKVRTQDLDAYGMYVIVWHPELGIMSMYCHLSQVLIKEGDQISIGKELGLTGMTGTSTGPHLHFEIRECSPDDFWDKDAGVTNVYKYCVDPMKYLNQIPADILGHWNQTNLVKAINDGVIRPNADNLVRPDGYCTRAEVVQIVYNIEE